MENIKEILAEHKKWLESGGKEGKRADFSGANLAKADLSGANLARANLQRADLQRGDFSGTNLSGADLTGTNLQWANLNRTNLSGANLSGAIIDFACWPLWCGAFHAKVDERIARQLLYHAFAVGIEFFPGGLTEEQKAWLQKFEHATGRVNSKM